MNSSYQPMIQGLDAMQSGSSSRTRPMRRRRNRPIELTNPGIPGADNRWFRSRGQARAAALRLATQQGPGHRIVWNDAHGPGQQPHYHVVAPNKRRVKGHFFYGKRVARKAPPNARRRRQRDGRGRPLYETELEDQFLGDIWGTITSGVSGWREKQLIGRAIASGERSENKLTNLVFHARHPELGGRPIRSSEKTLTSEWVTIRNNAVRPALAQATGRGSAGSGSRPAVPPIGSPAAATSGQALRTNAVRIAEQEWQRWGRGTRKEGEVAMRPILRAYWRSGVGWLPSGSTWWSSSPWSAAFISWVMRQAGAGSVFRYSARHTDYVGAAKRNRLAGNSNPFKAYRIAEAAPRVGDLVCKARSGSGITYDNVDKGSFASHCDIVVAVQPGQIKTIGGNVSDSVTKSSVRTNASGHIIDPRYYAIVRVGS